MKILNNLVLLKAVIDNTERTYKGTSLILGVRPAVKDQYTKNYAKRHFEVVQVPDKLVFPRSRFEFFESGYAFRYRTEMELQVGDIVWVKLRSGHRATEIQLNGEKFYLVHYADCYVAQRRNLHRDLTKPSKNRIMKEDAYFDIIPLNGNLICEKMYKYPTDKFAIKDKVEEPGKLKVKFIGSHSESYFSIVNEKFVELLIPRFNVKHKDEVQADGPYLNVEGEYFHDFNGEYQPVAIHRTNIAMIL